MSKLSKQVLEKLKEQRDKLNDRIQQKEARLKSSERKIDTRKKILIGSYFLDEAIKNGKLDDIKNKLDSFLTRNSDRRLFDLPELVEENN
jgi:hypothetical protein